MQKDVALPLLPTGPGQETDIVDFCVNHASRFAFRKSGSLWMTIFGIFKLLFIVVIVCLDNIFIIHICCSTLFPQYILILFCPISNRNWFTSLMWFYCRLAYKLTCTKIYEYSLLFIHRKKLIFQERKKVLEAMQENKNQKIIKWYDFRLKYN